MSDITFLLNMGGTHNFMENGKISIVVEDNATIYMKIERLPDNWTQLKALSLGYSRDCMAYRTFKGLGACLRFINNYLPKLDIKFA